MLLFSRQTIPSSYNELLLLSHFSRVRLCNPIDGSPPGSPVSGILQARTLEWVAISFSNAWKWKVKVKSLSHVRLFATPWTAAHQAPLSMGFSRPEYWSGLPLPSPPIMSIKLKWTSHIVSVWSWLWRLNAQVWIQSLLIIAVWYWQVALPL